MAKIKFSKNWNNKLNCRYFTTIRLATTNKIDYYGSCVGKTFDVILNDKQYCKARLIDYQVVKLFEILLNLTFTTYLDAELDRFEFSNLMKKMYSKKSEWSGTNTRFIILLFKKVD